MQTFQITLDPDAWTEIGYGYNSIAFDMVSANAGVEVYFTQTAADPGAVTGNRLSTWGEEWDFSVTGMDRRAQRVWVKGKGDIRGARQ